MHFKVIAVLTFYATIHIASSLRCRSGYDTQVKGRFWQDETCASETRNPVCMAATGKLKRMIITMRLDAAGWCMSERDCSNLSCGKVKEGIRRYPDASFKGWTLTTCEIKCCKGDNCNAVDFQDVTDIKSTGHSTKAISKVTPPPSKVTLPTSKATHPTPKLTRASSKVPLPTSKVTQSTSKFIRATSKVTRATVKATRTTGSGITAEETTTTTSSSVEVPLTTAKGRHTTSSGHRLNSSLKIQLVVLLTCGFV